MATIKISALTAAVGIDPVNDYLPIAQSGVTNKISRNTFLGTTAAVVDVSTTQTITGKIFGNTNSYTAKDGSFVLQNTADTTKQALFSLVGQTTGTTRTYGLPNASVTLASISGVETFTNKTLTSPVISGGSIDNATITVDSIQGHTSPTIVSIGGVQMNNGVVATAGAVNTNSIAVGAVVPNSLASGAGSGWAWQTFTPSWTNLTVGNGVIIARYTQIGKLVWVFVSFVLGTTSAIGTNPSFTPPVAASSTYATAATNVSVGFGALGAGAVGAQTIPFFAATAASISVGYGANPTGALSLINATTPGTWTSNNLFNFNAWYEAA